MAYSVAHSVHKFQASATSVTAAFASGSTTAGNFLVALVGMQRGQSAGITPPSGWLSVFGNTGTDPPAAGSAEAQIFYYPNCPSGLSSFTFSQPGSASNWEAVVLEISGLPTSIAVDQKNSATVNGTSLSVSTPSATTVASELAVALLQEADSFSITNPGGWGLYSQAFSDGFTIAAGFVAKELTTTGTQSASFSWGTVRNAVALIATFMTGTATYSYAGTGGLKLGGTASASSHTRVHSSSGGMSLGGTALTRTTATTHTFTTSGGMKLGGTAARSHARVSTPSGGMKLGGSARTSKTPPYIFTASGGMALGGTAVTGINPTRTSTYGPRGGMKLGGAAARTFAPVRQEVTLVGFTDEAIGVPFVDEHPAIRLTGFADEQFGTPTIAEAGAAEVTLVGFSDEQFGTLGLSLDIQLIGFRDNGVADSSQDSPWAPEDAFGLLGIAEVAQAVTLTGFTEDAFGVPFVLPQDALDNPQGPATPLVQVLLDPDADGDSVHQYFNALRNAVDPYAKDMIWTQRESDGTDTFEYTVPAGASAKLNRGAQITNPLNGVSYTVRTVKQTRDTSGTVVYHYVGEAPHYDLGYVAAIPFRTVATTDAGGDQIDHGASLGEVLSCLNQAGGGWSFSGSPCAAFAADGRCPFQENPSFDSTRASVLSQLYQVSALWGGRWFFDELGHRAYLECSVGAGSGVVADWQENLQSAERTEVTKPRQQVLVVEEQNGVLSGVTAQMMLAQLEADNACDDYLAQKALQDAQDAFNNADGSLPADYDPCVGLAAMQDIPTSLAGGSSQPYTLVQSDALKSARNYVYEAWLLEQMPQVTYAAAVLDTSMLPGGAANRRVELGSWVTVVDAELGINDAVRCVGSTYNLLEPDKSSVQLSNEIPWLSIVLPTSALKKDNKAKLQKKDKKPPLGPDTGFCYDNSSIEANWVPPPSCVGQGQKLLLALQDKLAQVQKLRDGAVAIDAKADRAIALLTSAEEGARAAGVFLNLDSFIQGLIDLKSKIASAILEAEVQVLEAEQAVAQAQTIATNEAAAQDSLKKCPEVALGGEASSLPLPLDEWLNKAYSLFNIVRTASNDLEKGHLEWKVRSFKFGDCGGDPLPSAPTPLGKGSGLDNATKSAANGACYYAKVTLPQVQADLQYHGMTSTHINCGDITTTLTPIGGNTSDPTPLLYQVFALSNEIVDANVILNKQWEKITETDALAEELRNNVKECVNKGLGSVFAGLADCQDQPTSMDAPGPGGAPFGSPVDPGAGGGAGVGGAPVGGTGGATAVTSPPRGGAGPDAGTNCLNHTAAIASALLGLTGAIDSAVGGVQSAVTAIDQLRSTAGELVAQTPPPSTDPDVPDETAASAPPWNIDASAVNAGINDLRGMAANLGGAAKAVLAAVQSLDPTSLDQMAAALGVHVDPNNPANATIIAAGADARGNLEAARNALNSAVCDAVMYSIALQNDLLQLEANRQAVDNAIWAYGQVIGNYQMSEDIQAQAVSALVNVPVLTQRLDDHARDLASYGLAMGGQVQALLDAVDCADSYVNLAGVDVQHQRSTSDLAQTTWMARTANTAAIPGIDIPNPTFDPGGNGRQVQTVSPDDPSLEYSPSEGDIWDKIPAD